MYWGLLLLMVIVEVEQATWLYYNGGNTFQWIMLVIGFLIIIGQVTLMLYERWE